MDRPTDATPATVPAGATHAGEVRARWAWAEPSAWTERMLTALEQGVKGGRWFSLIDGWPKACFAEQGLFSPAAAHATLCQSSRR